MKTLLCLIFATFLWSAASALADDSRAKADFFVSIHGSDEWSGTLPEPNASRNDGPFASLARARDAVRVLKETVEDDILVHVRAGFYRLDETVVFGLDDSGDEERTITYAAYPGERPIFSSAVAISDWKALGNPPAALPKVAHGKVMVADVASRFLTLYDEAGRLPRARSASFAPEVPATEPELTAFKGIKNKLIFPQGLLKDWSNVHDVELHIRPQHAWIENILPLASVDPEARVASTQIPGSYSLRPQLIRLIDSKTAWIENTLEELDEPGEWVLNSEEGRLYLWPRSESTVRYPQLRELIRIEGAIDREGPTDVPVRNLVFRGLSFMHGDRYTLKNDDAGLQHDWDMFDVDNALLRLRGAENCRIEDCHFSHSGGNAIRVDLYGQNIRIADNHIERMGGGGILLSGYGPGTKDVNRTNSLINNHIHHYGEIYRHSPGIMLWQSGENHVANNLIHDAPYSGVIVSGFLYHFFGRPDARELVRTVRWDEIGEVDNLATWEGALPFLHSHDNRVEYNEIHRVMLEMGDGNGIYIRGAGPGNIIRRNYIHHLIGPTRMQAAIRTDGGQRDTLIAENVVYKCTSKGIVLKLNNRIENNVIVDPIAARFDGALVPASFITLREAPVSDATIQRNILFDSGDQVVYFDERKERRFPVIARAKDAQTDDNIYYTAGDPSLSAAFLLKAQEEGADAHSQATDPLFMDMASGDFRLRLGSPARAMKIKSLDTRKMGLKADSPSDAPSSPEEQWEGEAFRDVIYKKIGRYELRMDIYMPPGKTEEPSPVIYYTHGGGWAAGSKEKFSGPLFLPLFQELAQEGFVCVAINYRLARKGRGVLIRDCVADAMDGLRFLNKNAERYGIDPSRIVVFGDSAGGQMAQMLALAAPNGFPGAEELARFGVQPVGGISWYGPTDFTDTKLFETDFSDKDPDRFNARIVGPGVTYADQPTAYKAVSPYYWLRPDIKPLLLIQGNRDATIPLAHAIHLQSKANQIGADVKTIVVENAGHNWRRAGGDPKPGLETIQQITALYAQELVIQASEKNRSHQSD